MNIEILIVMLVFFPIFTMVSLGIPLLFNFKPSEKIVNRGITSVTIIQIFISLSCFILFCLDPRNTIIVDFHHWFSIGSYEFELSFLYDRLSAPFTILISILVAIAAKYSSTYLHREGGYYRYFMLYLTFLSGAFLIVLSGTVDMVYAGWELVGLASVLLISFFHHQVSSVRNSFKALISYRICDIGLLAAASWLHFTYHASRFDLIFTNFEWPYGLIQGDYNTNLFIALCFVFASLGKSSQLPMSGWLPGAMEGPTPSSAIFYGAISIHLGAYLLLRVYPLYENIMLVRYIIFTIGILTAFYGTFVGRTRTDAKTILAYVTMAHVGVIFCEVALGWHYIAVFHICAHASLRTMQFLRSSSLIHDFLDNPLVYKDTLLKTGSYFERILSDKVRKRFYHLSLNRFYLDHLSHKFIIDPIIYVSKKIKGFEDKLTSSFGEDQTEELAEFFDDEPELNKKG